MAKPQALIVDDHPTVLSGLQNVLEEMSYDTTALTDANSALTDLRSNSYHLILLDMKLPDMDGKTLLNIIRISDSDTPVLIVSGELKTSDASWMLKNGAQGFIDKKEPTTELKRAIQTVASGEKYMPHQMQSIIMNAKKRQRPVEDYIGITNRQKQMIEFMEKGYTNKQISRELGIAEGTVAAHIRDVFRTLNVHTRTACVKVAKKLGIIDPD